MNVADSDMIGELLAQRGYSLAGSAHEADLIVVNTCSVRAHAEQRARARIAEYARLKSTSGKNPELWVAGCMAQRFGERLKEEIRGVDRVVGAIEVEELPGHIDRYLAGTGCGRAETVSRRGVTAFVPVMRGCDNYCAYCIVPYVRGREHSIPAADVHRTVQDLADSGVKEVTLIGQNVNSYRAPESGLDFADLLARVSTVEGIARIRFTTSHPKDCSEKLIRTVAELPALCTHLHLPVQSGSTRILGLMNRRYTRDDYLRLVEKMRTHMPECDITTDIMVGFPSETDADYRDTLSLVRDLRFTAAFMFRFSPRPGTRAAAMQDPVPAAVSSERLKELISIQTEITREHYRSMVGGEADILFTARQSRRERAWMGQTAGCRRALLSCRDDLAGTILRVKITRTTGMTLLCERIQACGC
jgi:tRNA-2-methylthio-N6-dimethylallyladenosine synthase